MDKRFLDSFILSHIGQAVVAIDNDEHVVYWNSSAEKMYGVSEKNALGKKLTDVYRYDFLTETDEKAAARSLKLKGFWKGKNVHTRKNKNVMYVESMVHVITDASGNKRGLLAFIRNIEPKLG
jgi:PAS domain S-box-containing protein